MTDKEKEIAVRLLMATWQWLKAGTADDAERHARQVVDAFSDLADEQDD